MKKNHAYRWKFACPPLTKLLRVMKLTTVLTLFAVMSANAHGFSQDAKITLSLKNVKIAKFFKEVEKETKYRFAFSDDILPVGRFVSVDVKEVPVKEVLQNVFSSTRLKFRFDEQSGIIIISEKVTEETVNNLITIVGKVTNASGEPLSGATVQVKGTAVATSTAADGTFSIEVPKNATTLIISYVGMDNQEVSIVGRTNIQVQLKPLDAALNEVVVVGYGTQKSKNITGAVARIGAKDIKEVAVLGVDQAITGRISGVQVTENSAEPGGEIQIKIRGVASITSGSDPLVVVDGVPMSVGLNAINPNDVESIDLLKDAASTAIYGSRASAGVILVTTKRGKAGKTAISFDAYTGTQKVIKKIPLLNGAQFAKLANENLVNGGQVANPAWSDPSKVLNTDWQDATFRSAPMSNYNLSISGGGEKVKTYFSFGYTKQNGIVRRSDYERFTSRINLDYELSSKLKFGTTISFNMDKKNNARSQEEFWGATLNAFRAQPTDPVYTDQEGPIGDHLYGFRGWAMNRSGINNNYYALSNPVFTGQYYNNFGKNTQLLTNAFGELEIIKGLKFKSLIGYNINDGNSQYGNPYTLPQAVDLTSRSYVNQTLSRGTQWNWVNTLSYTKSIGDHNFSVLAGSDALKGTGYYLSAGANRPPENQWSITASDLAGRTANGNNYTPFSLFSYLARATYNYKEKYLLAVNVRRDGSSKFASDNRFGVFPSASVGWRVSKESFMESVSFVNDLKFRGSYGVVGNQNIGDLQYLSTYGNDGGNYGYSFGSTPTLIPGLRPSVLGNKDIKWEKNTEMDFGLDATLFNNSITLTVDYYKKKLSDLLGTVPIPNYSAPFNGSFLANAFTMENSGFEFTVGFKKSVGKLNLSGSANISTIKNNVTALLPGNTSGYLTQNISMMGSAFNDGGAQTRTYVGHPIGEFWGYVADGIIQNATELAASGMSGFDAKVGDRRYKDVNGDKKIDDNDKTFIGNGIPGYIYGFNFRAEYKGFDISAFFNGQGDVEIANMTYGLLTNMRFHNSTGIVNGSTDLLNSWKGEGTSNTMPRNSYDAPTSNRFFSTSYIENGAFLRMRNLQLGYTIPGGVSKKAFMSNARVYVSAQNFLTITKYKGYDPELGSATIGTRAQTIGVDYGRYPKPRIITFGISVQF